MIDFLIDTDVLVEFLRGSPFAKEWFESVQDKIIGLPVFVYLEILQGAENRNQQNILMKQMKEYNIIHLETGDSQLAQIWFEKFHLSHRLGLLDALIASIAKRRNKPFFTFNTKHYKIIKELDVKVPYKRNN